MCREGNVYQIMKKLARARIEGPSRRRHSQRGWVEAIARKALEDVRKLSFTGCKFS